MNCPMDVSLGIRCLEWILRVRPIGGLDKVVKGGEGGGGVEKRGVSEPLVRDDQSRLHQLTQHSVSGLSSVSLATLKVYVD